MKLLLSLAPSFSAELFGWNATAPASGRGSVTAHWSFSEGREERRRARWAHPFDEARVRSILALLERLRERCGPGLDDAAEQRIAVEAAGVGIARVRVRSSLRADEAARAFDALWRELYEPVERCLVELGVPRELL
jgi:hypothetical protein